MRRRQLLDRVLQDHAVVPKQHETYVQYCNDTTAIEQTFFSSQTCARISNHVIK